MKIPIYNLAAREDHIAPARSVFTGAKLFGGQVRYVLAGSGHIAGVINPARKPKYQYWTGGDAGRHLRGMARDGEETSGHVVADWIDWSRRRRPTRSRRANRAAASSSRCAMRRANMCA